MEHEGQDSALSESLRTTVCSNALIEEAVHLCDLASGRVSRRDHELPSCCEQTDITRPSRDSHGCRGE